MPVFYTKHINGREAYLDEEESRHLYRVLRLRENDRIDMVDGAGSLYRASISAADPRSTRVRILETIKDHLLRPFHLHIAIAPTKSNDRFEWFLEKATEIGIEEITPILCRRSERDRIRHERSEKILLAAMKQSGRALLPKLNPMLPLQDLLDRAEADMKWIAHCGCDRENLPDKPGSRKTSWLVLIGPEGDFTPEEVESALDRDYLEISLGDAVYRTETAGILACHWVGFLNR
jgi:16S rRNA (uracil1498-N3)-methyltransferase